MATVIAATSNAGHAPKVRVAVLSRNGHVTVDALPDTGADICAASVGFLSSLNDDLATLCPVVGVDPKAADGSPMACLGSVPVTMSLGNQSVEVDIHILDGVTGLLLSWSTTQELALIPANYPAQIGCSPGPMSSDNQSTSTPQLECNSCKVSPVPTREDLIAEFPSVFNGVVCTMPGEVFKIALADA